MSDLGWTQAIDRRWLTQLLKPLEQPGLIGGEPARRILAAIERMRGSLPLLERVSRYVETGEFADSGVPIILARFPAPPEHLEPEALRPAETRLAQGSIRRAVPAPIQPEAATVIPSVELPRVSSRATQPAEIVAKPESPRLAASDTVPFDPVPVTPSDPMQPPRIVLPAGRRRQRRSEGEDSMSEQNSAPLAPNQAGSPGPGMAHRPPSKTPAALGAAVPESPLPLPWPQAMDTPPGRDFPLPLRRRNHGPEARPESASLPGERPALTGHDDLAGRQASRHPVSKMPAAPSLFSAALPAVDGGSAPIAMIHRSTGPQRAMPAAHETDDPGIPAALAEPPPQSDRLPRNPGHRLSSGPSGGSTPAAPPLDEQQSLITDLVDKALRRFMRNLDVDRERRRMRP